MADEIVTVDSLVNQHAAQKNAPTDKPPVTDPPPISSKTDDLPAPDPLKDLLKEFNVENVDALREKLKPKQETPPLTLSPEEKEKQDNLYQVDLQRYAVENGIMKPDDFVQMQNLKGREDRSLVYDRWLPSWKEENPDVSAEEAEQQAREAFESEYHLNSQNEKTRLRGEARVKKEATDIRNPVDTAYVKAKTEFDEDRSIQAAYPDFNKKISGFIQENIPEKVKFWEAKDGDETIPVEVELTAEQRKDLYQKVSQKIMNSGTYQLYKKGDMTQLQDIVKRETENMIRAEHREAGLAKIADTFLKRGVAKAKKGSENPFPLVNNNRKPVGGAHTTAEQQVLDSLNGR